MEQRKKVSQEELTFLGEKKKTKCRNTKTFKVLQIRSHKFLLSGGGIPSLVPQVEKLTRAVPKANSYC